MWAGCAHKPFFIYRTSRNKQSGKLCVTIKKPVQRRFFIHFPTLSTLDILRITSGQEALPFKTLKTPAAPSTGYPQISTGYPQP